MTLIGRPPLLRGHLYLDNPGDAKLKLKRALLTLKHGAWGDAGGALVLQVAARVAPGAASHVPVALPVGPRVPPGEYRGEAVFEALKETREVVLQVLEHRALAVHPTDFELHAASGSEASLPAVLINTGNVPYALPKAVPLTLAENNAFNALFHAAMARQGAQGHHAALDAFAELLSASEVESGRVVFEADGGRTLAPGETLATRLGILLPARLSRRRAYNGVFSLGKTTCTVDIGIDTAITEPPDLQ